jgi:hypothetical protein
VHEQREKGRAHDDRGRPRADGAENAIDDRIQDARIGHHAEEQDREDEHRRDRRRLLDARDDERARLQPEAAHERGHDRHDDQRDERGRLAAQDERQHQQHGRETQERKHGAKRHDSQARPCVL